MAGNAPETHWLHDSNDRSKQLLLKLLHIFKAHPNLPVGQLLTHWESPEEQAWIAELAAKEHPFSEDGYLQEFLDTLASMERQDRQQKIDALIKLSKQQTLTADQRQTLTTLLSNQ